MTCHRTLEKCSLLAPDMAIIHQFMLVNISQTHTEKREQKNEAEEKLAVEVDLEKEKKIRIKERLVYNMDASSHAKNKMFNIGQDLGKKKERGELAVFGSSR